MAINLKKEEAGKCFSFSDIDLENIKENKRVFIPYEKLPDSEEMRYSYLENLISFIERETGKHYSYFFVNETEPYEMNGFFIQIAPELKDRNGVYVNNNDFVYDNNGEKWHVTYYYKDNQPCIIVDNEASEVKVVSGLSEFSLDYDETFAVKLDKSDKVSANMPIVEITISILFLIAVIVVFAISIHFCSSAITDMATNLAEENENSILNALMSLLQPAFDNIHLLLTFLITTLTISFTIRIIKKFFYM